MKSKALASRHCDYCYTCYTAGLDLVITTGAAMKIGFIGLGIMGRPMALNLLHGGHPLTVWARRAESMQPLLDAGAGAAVSPAGWPRWSMW
jgi:hypothetical protein